MKKFLLLLCAFALLSCTDVINQLNDIEERLTNLETICKDLNEDISSISSIIEVMQENDYVTGVSKIIKDGKEIGYTISFNKNEDITIYNGIDGKDGKDGENGKDGKDGLDGVNGSTPSIGVNQDSDQKWYWTVDGNWITDKDGNKISASGADGITPELKIENECWYLSLDKGKTWKEIGSAVDTSLRGYTFIEKLVDTEGSVQLTLTDGTILTLPKEKPLGLVFGDISNLACIPGTSLKIPFHINGDSEGLKIDCINSAIWDSSVQMMSANEGYVLTTAPEESSSCKIIVIATNGRYIDMVTLIIDKGVITYEDNKYSISSAGGIIEFPYDSNIDISISIPEQAQTWLTAADTKAAVVSHTISFMVQPNTTEYVRHADISIFNKDKDLIGEIRIAQYASYKPLDISHKSIHFPYKIYSKSYYDEYRKIKVNAVMPWHIITEDFPGWLNVYPSSSDLMDGEETEVTIRSSNTSYDNAKYDLKFICNGEVFTIPVYKEGRNHANSIYYNNFDKTPISENTSLNSSEDWKNETGLGVDNLLYSNKSISVRATNPSSNDANKYIFCTDGYGNENIHYYSISGYNGSGSNNLFFGNSPHLIIRNIDTVDQEHFSLTFGIANETSSKLHVYISTDDEKWVELEYTTTYNERIHPGYCNCSFPAYIWGLASAEFTLDHSVKSFNLCFKADESSLNRIDDLLISTTYNEGKLIDFSEGKVLDFTVEPENPEGNVQKATILEFLEYEAGSDEWFELTGKIIDIENEVKGNITIDDGTGQLYIYGVTSAFSATNDNSFSSLNLKTGDTITLATLKSFYNGAAQGGGSIPAYYISHTEGVDTTLKNRYRKVDTVTSGKHYLIYASGIVAGPLSSTYGYLPKITPEFDGEDIMIDDKAAVTITETEDGYTILMSNKRYLYLTGTYNSFNFSDSPSSGHYWSITKRDDGLFNITNILKNKTIQYSPQHESFGAYPDSRGDFVELYEFVQ